jgi:hypothetical protein
VTGRCLEYTKAGEGARLSMIVLHDDARRKYAYGPTQPTRHQGRELSPGAVRQGEEGRLVRHWHERRLERIFAFE